MKVSPPNVTVYIFSVFSPRITSNITCR